MRSVEEERVAAVKSHCCLNLSICSRLYGHMQHGQYTEGLNWLLIWAFYLLMRITAYELGQHL